MITALNFIASVSFGVYITMLGADMHRYGMRSEKTEQTCWIVATGSLISLIFLAVTLQGNPLSAPVASWPLLIIGAIAVAIGARSYEYTRLQ